MDRTTALVVVTADCSDTEVRKYLSSVPDQGLHLSFLVIGAAATLPIWAYGTAPYGPIVFPEDWQEQYQLAGQAVTDRADQIEQLLQSAGVEGDVMSAFCEAQMVEDSVSARASLCDIVFLDSSLSQAEQVFQPSLDGALFKTPSGVVLNSNKIGAVLGAKHPIVAWDASLPSVRAVHRALPILKQAEQVTVAVFDPHLVGDSDAENPGTDLATWLSRHGCSVTVQEFPSGGKEIGHCILDRTSEIGADLIVMGAYSHSRTRQWLLGGTTQIVIEQSKHRVLLAH